MKSEQLDLLDKIMKAEIKQNTRWIEYWETYSHFFTWQFWVVLAMFIIPLVLVILFIDRRKIFQIGFYGYSVHVFFTYTDLIGTHHGQWIYPYKLHPFIPSSLTLDASLVPVIYMMLYQYTFNKGKNYYIWITVLCLTLAFIFKPLMVGIGLFHFRKKENFFILFVGYAVVALISKWITDLFIYLKRTSKFSLYRGE